jgi:hypothetical protein
LPFSQIAANSESIPRRGFFGIHASIAQWLPNAPALRRRGTGAAWRCDIHTALFVLERFLYQIVCSELKVYVARQF